MSLLPNKKEMPVRLTQAVLCFLRDADRGKQATKQHYSLPAACIPWELVELGATPAPSLGRPDGPFQPG